MSGKSRPHVIVVGGGFGGLEATKSLAHLPVEITLVDRKNHHTFQPLLYQVATAGLSPAEIAAPIREIFAKHENVEVLLGDVLGFDLERRIVKLHGFELPYDYLVIAAGVTHAYFGHDDWEPFAPGLKTVEDALEMRRRILLAYELAEREAALTGQHRPLNFVVIGAGPTGVELAGTLAEIARKSLSEDFRNIEPAKTRVLLVEAGPSVLSAYPDDLRQSAVKQLQRLGVEVRTNSAVRRTCARVEFASERKCCPPQSCCGPLEYRHRLWAALSARRSTAPDACWSRPISAFPDIARSSSLATWPA